jgi:hypothetical protein
VFILVGFFGFLMGFIAALAIVAIDQLKGPAEPVEATRPPCPARGLACCVLGDRCNFPACEETEPFNPAMD